MIAAKSETTAHEDGTVKGMDGLGKEIDQTTRETKELNTQWNSFGHAGGKAVAKNRSRSSRTKRPELSHTNSARPR